MNPTSLDFAQRLDEVFDASTREIVNQAEHDGRFPRSIIEVLGKTGVLAEKWTTGIQPDLGKLFMLAKRLGRTASAGISVGVSLHDSAIAVLRRFGRSDYLKDLTERAIRGEAVLCVAASEESGGSDLQVVTSVAQRENDGYRLRGHKKFVSLSTVSDVALVVVREAREENTPAAGGAALFAIESRHLKLGDTYAKLGAACLDTAPVSFDTWVPEEAMVARAGTGLAALSWGLGHERLSVAGQVVGSCELALGVTIAHMRQRQQFGKRLIDHQALRLRLADLYSRINVLGLALDGLAYRGGHLDLRMAAALKVTAVRLGEEVMSECLHIFGGAGYLADETPIGRWWRDMKLGRVGGGADEVLWELVASGMQPDLEEYERWVGQ